MRGWALTPVSVGARACGSARAQFIDSLHSTDPLEEAADNLVMAALLSVRLRSVALSLGHPVVCSEYWGQVAERALEAEGLPYHTWDEAQMRRELDVTNISMSRASL